MSVQLKTKIRIVSVRGHETRVEEYTISSLDNQFRARMVKDFEQYVKERIEFFRSEMQRRGYETLTFGEDQWEKIKTYIRNESEIR